MRSATKSKIQSKPFVPFPDNLVAVRIVGRRNRFVIEATVGETIELEFNERAEETRSGANPFDDRGHPSPLLLHMPNTGRMQELLTPGTVGLAALDGGGERKTAGTLLLVRHEGRWVSVDARMPNRLFAQCLAANYLPPFHGYDEWRAEVTWGKGRIDFKLSGPDKPHYLVEAKSCNLVENGLALFPDAPTDRGTRHLTELAEAIEKGYRAAVIWFVQRDDAEQLAPHRRADPVFARALHDARSAGVEAYAYRCHVSPAGIEVLDTITVIDPPDSHAIDGHR